MLVELSVMEQRYQAVMAVIQDGWKVTEVAERLGVTRQSVHNLASEQKLRAAFSIDCAISSWPARTTRVAGRLCFHLRVPWMVGSFGLVESECTENRESFGQDRARS